MSEFQLFQSYNTLEEAKGLIEDLTNNEIEYEIENNSNIEFSSFSNKPIPNMVTIRIKKEDFEKVDKLIKDGKILSVNGILNDYYLFDFTDNELKEILEQPDEWSKEDYLNAREILKERGKVLSDENIRQLKINRNASLMLPEKGNLAGIIVGYSFALLGGLFGIVIGYLLLTLKKTVPDGSRVFAYNRMTRTHGGIILVIGSLSIIGWLFYKYLFF